jgi:hypothetical protein
MTAVLSGIQGIRCLVYLDDVVIFGPNLETHNDRLREVFSRMRNYNLKLQPDKCEFVRKELSYLGHVIGPMGVGVGLHVRVNFRESYRVQLATTFRRESKSWLTRSLRSLLRARKTSQRTKFPYTRESERLLVRE